jgi:chromosome segregation ATPase
VSPAESGELAGLRSGVDKINRQIKEALRRLSKVERRAEETDKQLDKVGERVTTLATGHDETRRQLQAGVDGVRREVDWLRGQLEQLEGLLRREHGRVPVDLDAVPEELGPLVDDIRRAEQIRASLLDNRARGFRRQQLEAFEESRNELAETRRQALAAAGGLTGGKDRGWSFHRAAATYRTVRARLRDQETRLESAKAPRDAAETELRHDAEQQQAYRTHPGAAATDRLAEHVRRQIDAAIDGYELLPSWFTIVLRHRPPATRAEEWRDAAVQLVLYRITYEVTDRVVALGPAPAGDHRIARYEAVRAALLRLDEAPQPPG